MGRVPLCRACGRVSRQPAEVLAGCPRGVERAGQGCTTPGISRCQVLREDCTVQGRNPLPLWAETNARHNRQVERPEKDHRKDDASEQHQVLKLLKNTSLFLREGTVPQMVNQLARARFCFETASRPSLLCRRFGWRLPLPSGNPKTRPVALALERRRARRNGQLVLLKRLGGAGLGLVSSARPHHLWETLRLDHQPSGGSNTRSFQYDRQSLF
jgi:hypothetical protein